MTIKAQMQRNELLGIATHLAMLNETTFVKQKRQRKNVLLSF